MNTLFKTISGVLRLIGVLFIFIGMSGYTFAQEGDPVAGEKVFKKCSACHKVGDNAKNAVGPVLNGVVGRTAGTFEGYKYGSGLLDAKEKRLVWDEETIFGWIGDPRAWIREYLGDEKAKAKMTFKLKKEQDRRDVIAYLKTL